MAADAGRVRSSVFTLEPEGWQPSIGEPVFANRPTPTSIGRWLFGAPGYLLPWNAIYLAIPAALWFWLAPSTETTADLSPGWIALLLARNLVVTAAWFALFHTVLNSRRLQGQRYKFTPAWASDVSERASARFTWNTQLRDNVWWTLASGVPIWTAFEVLTLWLAANDLLPADRLLGSLADNAAWTALALFLVPLIREVHFDLTHRALHWQPLYKRVHSLHHRNTNPTAWSGLAMHPIEHVAYFSVVIVLWLISGNPFVALFAGWHAVLAPAPGHAGVDRITGSSTSERGLDTNGYTHYLHHKLFDVNYSDGALPLDRWFGTDHDGSPNADERLRQRRRTNSQTRRAT